MITSLTACPIRLTATWVRVMVFNATFNNILVISWWSVLLMEETGINARRKPPCHKSLTNFIT
jgi:hypothetical protein